MDSKLVYLRCVKEGKKLRVKIISNGYNHEANCQFPRKIRVEGAVYSVPIEDVYFSEMRSKFFYRIKKNNIQIINDSKVRIANIYEGGDSSECIICMSNPYEVVLVYCGHYCMCKTCADQLLRTTKKCPICRAEVAMAVTRDRIQT